MPANLTPNYLAAADRLRTAESDEDKLTALAEMYATIPKHKGTEHMRADIRRRISELRKKDKHGAKHGKHSDVFHVVKEGAGQILLIGPPNSGKSSILARLTAAVPEAADYPGTTRIPLPGMMEYEDILIQLVDTPPIMPEAISRAVIGMTRTADTVAIVLDATDDAILDRLEEIRQEDPSHVALIIANKIDMPDTQENVAVLREFYENEFVIREASAMSGEGLEELRRVLFDALGIIRVYTKMPGKSPDTAKPFTLRKGSTLQDFAITVHKDLANKMRFAKAWGSDIINGTHIGREHELRDGYIVELHA